LVEFWQFRRVTKREEQHLPPVEKYLSYIRNICPISLCTAALRTVVLLAVLCCGNYQ